MSSSGRSRCGGRLGQASATPLPPRSSSVFSTMPPGIAIMPRRRSARRFAGRSSTRLRIGRGSSRPSDSHATPRRDETSRRDPAAARQNRRCAGLPHRSAGSISDAAMPGWRGRSRIRRPCRSDRCSARKNRLGGERQSECGEQGKGQVFRSHRKATYSRS